MGKGERKSLIVFPTVRRSQTKNFVPFTSGNQYKNSHRNFGGMESVHSIPKFWIFLTRYFCSIWFSAEIYGFLVAWFTFRKFINFGIFWKLSQDIFVSNLTPLQNIQNSWLDRKHPKCDLKRCKMKVNYSFQFLFCLLKINPKILKMVCVVLIAKWTKWSWEFVYGVF